jgi:hypothetical protein
LLLVLIGWVPYWIKGIVTRRGSYRNIERHYCAKT